MKKLECIIRPSKLEAVKEALGQYGVQGMTVTQVLGCGLQKGKTEVYRGSEYTVDLLPKVKLELVISDAKVEEVVQIVKENAATSKIGDGKIFISSMEDAVRIRTGERGDSAI